MVDKWAGGLAVVSCHRINFWCSYITVLWKKFDRAATETIYIIFNPHVIIFDREIIFWATHTYCRWRIVDESIRTRGFLRWTHLMVVCGYISLRFARRIGYFIPKTEPRISTEPYQMACRERARQRGCADRRRREGNETRIYHIPHSRLGKYRIMYTYIIVGVYSDDDGE